MFSCLSRKTHRPRKQIKSSNLETLLKKIDLKNKSRNQKEKQITNEEIMVRKSLENFTFNEQSQQQVTLKKQSKQKQQNINDIMEISQKNFFRIKKNCFFKRKQNLSGTVKFVQQIEKKEQKDSQQSQQPQQQQQKQNILQNKENQDKIPLNLQEISILNISADSIFKEIESNNQEVIVYQEGSLKQDIDQFVNTLTDRTQIAKINKTTQSSLKGMFHEISQDQVEEYSIQVLEAQFRSKNLTQAFKKSVIAQQYELASKIFTKMTRKQKNLQNEQQMSPLKLVALSTIVNSKNSKILKLLRTIAYDSEVVIHQCCPPNPLIGHICYKPIQEAIRFRNIAVLTHLFKASYQSRKNQIEESLKNFIDFLATLQDFSMEIDANICSFLPLIEHITPDDHIIIHKKGDKIRIDYTLIGYQSFKCKRRQMSCIIGKFENPQEQVEKCMILAVNHRNQTYTDILQKITKQQLALIIQDLLSTQWKRGNPQIIDAKLTKTTNIFGDKIRDKIHQIISDKCLLKVQYNSHTEKFFPGIKKASDLQYLSDLESYQKHYQSPRKNKKVKKKQLCLDIWIPQSFPLELQKFIKIMEYFSYSNDTAKIIHQFLSQNIIRSFINQLPTRIQIPINFTLYLQIQMQKVNKNCEISCQFNYIGKYKKIPRHQYQKTLERKGKRLLLAKLYI